MNEWTPKRWADMGVAAFKVEVANRDNAQAT
jgi:hypothetical protein